MIPISLMVGGREEDSSNPLGAERSDLNGTKRKQCGFLKMIIPKGWGKGRARCFGEGEAGSQGEQAGELESSSSLSRRAVCRGEVLCRRC